MPYPLSPTSDEGSLVRGARCQVPSLQYSQFSRFRWETAGLVSQAVGAGRPVALDVSGVVLVVPGSHHLLLGDATLAAGLPAALRGLPG